MRPFTVAGVTIVVVRDGDELYALRDQCTHEEYPLSEGWLEDGCLFCPMHGAKFDLRTGAALSLPAYEDVATFPVRVREGMVEVKME
ncbi:non-heme iron oxygenase ferredoxin subunit [candidate division KSB1 bacterium]|nr:non-heme iron oxygenase ferredoxin subunit [candidate division KSB1 bacterium]RQW03347.1 MAG: non-heme iron oxygenase ferredoxin subunit [candidate division KSB1 bacterium]